MLQLQCDLAWGWPPKASHFSPTHLSLLQQDSPRGDRLLVIGLVDGNHVCWDELALGVWF